MIILGLISFPNLKVIVFKLHLVVVKIDVLVDVVREIHLLVKGQIIQAFDGRLRKNILVYKCVFNISKQESSVEKTFDLLTVETASLFIAWSFAKFLI